MSDTRPEYGDWRQASDGKWYPPSSSSAACTTEAGPGYPGAGWRNHPDTGELRFWDGEAWGVTASEYLGHEPTSTALAVAETVESAAAGTGWFADTADSMRFWNGTEWVGECRPITFPPTPWGTWTWPNGSGIDFGALPPVESKNRLIAAALGITGAGLALHKFYLDQKEVGIKRILLTVVGGILTCGAMTLGMIGVGVTEGVIYLTKSDAEFYWTYVAQKKEWF